VRATAADALPLAGSEAASARLSAEPGTHDRVLFEALRGLRRSIAEERGVPPYLVFSDASLRDMARLKPRTREALLEVKGVGAWKSETFGDRFLALIRQQA
jgi:ATP-dependent DNA helicase RecQ